MSKIKKSNKCNLKETNCAGNCYGCGLTTKGQKRVLLQGNEACVEGGIAAGMRFFAGYPITPSTEVAEQAALRLPQVGGRFIQMEDEIAAMAAIIGGSAAGVKSMTATSGPGFSLKQENLGYACFAEVPCVIVCVQRSGPSTGLPTSPSQGDIMQARWGTHGDHPIIALAPANVAECYSLTVRCFNLSEKYRVPVLLMTDEIVGHLREGIVIPDPKTVEVYDRKVDKSIPPFKVPKGEVAPLSAPFGQGQRYNITGLVHNEKGFPTNSTSVAGELCTRLMKKIEDNLDDIIEYEERHIEDAEVVVVAYGGTTRAAVSAVNAARAKGKKVGLFRPITIWPFAQDRVAEIAKKVKKIVVAEHNYGQLVHEIDLAAKGQCKIGFVGKVDGTIIMPDEIEAEILR
ncbi:MAG: 2-oxoacid:acceptor oxidoreductase subunit alpha [Firmicutes bacterium]|nr:2-oxoacid:acceptor oxidoreductase subunit alpha [Bacillota bacterium]